MRTFVSFLGGALSVGLVVGVLAAAGVIDDDAAPTSAPTAAPPSPPIAKTEDSSVSSRASDISQLYKRVAAGVVFVQAGQTGSGSGFIYDDEGHIVTNDHVVENASSFLVRIGVDTKPIPARLMGKDPSSDLAVLKIDPGAVKGGLKPLALGDSNALEPGDQAIAIGSPFGLEGSVTTGIVSPRPQARFPQRVPERRSRPTPRSTPATRRAAAEHQRPLIGVNSQIKTGSGANAGVGFAVPVSTVKFVVPQIKDGGKVERAYLGISNGTPQDRSGAVVDTVVPGGPAAGAGLQPNDKIVDIDGRTIQSSEDVSAAVDARKPGEQARGDGDPRRRPAYPDSGSRNAPGEPGRMIMNPGDIT